MKPTLRLVLCLSAPLVLGCSTGTISAQDESRDAEADPREPDAGDVHEDAPEDGTLDDGDEQGDEARLEQDGPAEDGELAGDEGPGPGTEMLLFDGDGRQFTFDESGFHVLLDPGDPLPADDWLAPIDYFNGEFHVRYVINSPADQQAGRLQTCIWTMGDDGVGGNYFPESCGQQVSHTGVGEYRVTGNLAPATWWKKDGVPLDYSHPERFLVRVVLRGESGCNVTRYNVSGACWDEWPRYQNMNFRVTIVMVGAGESFSGWGSYP